VVGTIRAAGSGFQPKPCLVMPLEKDPSRIVRLQTVVLPPGDQFDHHPGDPVQQGEVTYTVKGQARQMKRGDWV
jgi:hypothetical protein